MTLEDIESINSYWHFTTAVTLESRIECPSCKEFSSVSEWRNSEVECELCGEHDAIRCPKCGYDIDHVWSPIITVAV